MAVKTHLRLGPPPWENFNKEQISLYEKRQMPTKVMTGIELKPSLMQ